MNFEGTLEETEVGRERDPVGNSEEYDQNRQSGVNGGSDATHQSAEYEGKSNGRDTIHDPLGSEPPSHLTIHLQPFTDRPTHTPSTITSRGVEGGTLTTSLNNNPHTYSPMSDSNINLQNIAAAAREYAADSDAAGYAGYKDASQLPTRRQNVACDACRARKVKCVRKPMAEQVSRGHGAMRCGLICVGSAIIVDQRERRARKSSKHAREFRSPPADQYTSPKSTRLARVKQARNHPRLAVTVAYRRASTFPPHQETVTDRTASPVYRWST